MAPPNHPWRLPCHFVSGHFCNVPNMRLSRRMTSQLEEPRPGLRVASTDDGTPHPRLKNSVRDLLVEPEFYEHPRHRNCHQTQFEPQEAAEPCFYLPNLLIGLHALLGCSPVDRYHRILPDLADHLSDRDRAAGGDIEREHPMPQVFCMDEPRVGQFHCCQPCVRRERRDAVSQYFCFETQTALPSFDTSSVMR